MALWEATFVKQFKDMVSSWELDYLWGLLRCLGGDLNWLVLQI